MATRKAAALAVGCMTVCAGMALATIDKSVAGAASGWLPFTQARTSVHYKNSSAPYLVPAPKISGQLNADNESQPRRQPGYWI